MLQIIKLFINYYKKRNRWWIPLVTGIPCSLCLLPFNHEIHWVFAFFPLFSFFALIPLFFFSLHTSLVRTLFHVYLFSLPIALGQCFWLIFVKIEGLWVLIIAGMVLLAAYVALFYTAAGIAFRLIYKKFPGLTVLLFPCCWIVIDFSRTLGDISFPWGFLGYNMTPLLPVSQLAAITGVWGLTFLIVMGNVLVWNTLIQWYRKDRLRIPMIKNAVFCLLLVAVIIWGWFRIAKKEEGRTPVKLAILQTALDQLNWGSNSLDTAFAITDSMVFTAAESKPDLIVGPESALLCYLARQRKYARRVRSWANSTNVPIFLGALHWEKPSKASAYQYYVYNTAFLVKPSQRALEPYRKIKLVPFSEAIPFEGLFPILSRVNLGEADFQRGKEATIFSIHDSITFAPFICYESIYPGFVQKRLRQGGKLIVHITNDGWFGKTTGPYQHAIMARMRAIENGVAMARCAITGISMFIDPLGRILQHTKLGKRVIIEDVLPLQEAKTFYSRFGDWFVVVCMIIILGTTTVISIKKWHQKSSAENK